MSKWKIKGPWYFVEHNWEATSIYDADRETVCAINIHPDVTEETQDHFEAITASKVDAIAALPDLIEAAENMLASDTDERWDAQEYMAAKHALRSALAKAKGESK
jgi:hypothetical protein